MEKGQQKRIVPSPTEDILWDTTGNREPLWDREVRGQVRSRLTFVWGLSSGPFVHDPDPDTQNLVPMWDLFTHRREGVRAAGHVHTYLLLRPTPANTTRHYFKHIWLVGKRLNDLQDFKKNQFIIHNLVPEKCGSSQHLRRWKFLTGLK